MNDFNALYNRYIEEANAYAAKFGLDPRTAARDGHWDAFRHAYASAAMTKDYEDHPLSQEEIERIRQNQNTPRGGLF